MRAIWQTHARVIERTKQNLVRNSPDQRRFKVEEAVQLLVDVAGVTVRILLLLLLQQQLLLLLCLLLLLGVEQLLKLQAARARLVFVTWLDEFQLAALVSPPEIRRGQ